MKCIYSEISLYSFLWKHLNVHEDVFKTIDATIQVPSENIKDCLKERIVLLNYGS